MIIKTCSTVKLRSLGMNIHLKGRLVGNSCLWVFTRIDSPAGDIPPLRPICMIRKMVDTQRVFCVFGHKSRTFSPKGKRQSDSFSGRNTVNRTKSKKSKNSENNHQLPVEPIDFGERDSLSSNDNEVDFDLKPSTSFQFFKN